MKEQIEKSEFLILSPPERKSSQEKNFWLAGIWILPGLQTEILNERMKVLEYHWDDRSKLETDVKSIKLQIVKLKQALYPVLNRIHQANYSERYWDVLVGEWIYLYTQVVFDRWSVMETAFKNLKNLRILEDFCPERKIPFDTINFQIAAISNHNWNANLMRDIYNEFRGKSSNRNERCISIDIPSSNERIRTGFRRNLVNLFSRLYLLLIRNKQAIVLQTPYLSKINAIKICIKTKAMMHFGSKQEYFPREKNCDVELRNLLANSLGPKHLEEPFFNFLLKNIDLHFPAIYLEEYGRHKNYSEQQYFNCIPRIIVTANSHYSNECWKSWAASSVEKGARIVLLQHGGHYGHSKFSLIQDYEIELGDKFLSWGWTSANNKQVTEAPASKLIGLQIKRKTRITCLVVTFETSTYSSWLASFPIGPQVSKSKEMTLEFLNRIENPVRDAIRVRTYPVDYGLNQKNEFQLKFPGLAFSPNNRDFKKDLKDTRIVVFNYFSTTLIEALKLGIPSVAFVDPNHWEVNESFKDLFTLLRNIGILHHSSDSCAQFVMQNWDSIEDWWTESTTVKVVEEFLRFFGYTGSNPIHELSNAILDF